MNYLKKPDFAQTILRQRSTGWLYTSRNRSSGDRDGGHCEAKGRGRMGDPRHNAYMESFAYVHTAGTPHLT